VALTLQDLCGLTDTLLLATSMKAGYGPPVKPVTSQPALLMDIPMRKHPHQWFVPGKRVGRTRGSLSKWDVDKSGAFW